MALPASALHHATTPSLPATSIHAVQLKHLLLPLHLSCVAKADGAVRGVGGAGGFAAGLGLGDHAADVAVPHERQELRHAAGAGDFGPQVEAERQADVAA